VEEERTGDGLLEQRSIEE